MSFIPLNSFSKYFKDVSKVSGGEEEAKTPVPRTNTQSQAWWRTPAVLMPRGRRADPLFFLPCQPHLLGKFQAGSEEGQTLKVSSDLYANACTPMHTHRHVRLQTHTSFTLYAGEPTNQQTFVHTHAHTCTSANTDESMHTLHRYT